MFALARRQYSGDDIAQRVAILRRDTGLGEQEYFNIVDFVECPLRNWLRDQGRGDLKIRLSYLQDNNLLPHVELGALDLHASAMLWDEAGLGEPDARYKIAHEIGHLVLHAYLDFRFSPDEVATPGLVTPTVEREANRFAHDFLVPKSVALNIGNPRDIARRCSVPREVAEAQFAAIARIAGPPVDFCICGQLTSNRDATGAPRCIECVRQNW